MNPTILDATEKKEDGRYARRSFWLFLMALGGYIPIILIGLFMPSTIKVSDQNAMESFKWVMELASVFVFLGHGLSLFGLANAIKSIKRSEPTDYQKTIGLIGNALMLLLIIAMLIANIIDLQRMIES